MDTATRRVMRSGRVLDLTSREFELLEYLLRHQGHLVSREMLAREVWKEPRRGTPLDNVIDVQIARLRRKVDSDAGVRLIHTIRGVGFVLKESEPHDRALAGSIDPAPADRLVRARAVLMMVMYATAIFVASVTSLSSNWTSNCTTTSKRPKDCSPERRRSHPA